MQRSDYHLPCKRNNLKLMTLKYNAQSAPIEKEIPKHKQYQPGLQCRRKPESKKGKQQRPNKCCDDVTDKRAFFKTPLFIPPCTERQCDICCFKSPSPKKEPPTFYSRGTSLFVLGYQTSYNYFINCLVKTASPAFTWIR
jgi:hypothetical protein